MVMLFYICCSFKGTTHNTVHSTDSEVRQNLCGCTCIRGKGSSIKYVRTEGGGGSRSMCTHCVHGGRGRGGGAVRAAAYVHIFEYSANVFTFDKYHIIVEYNHNCIKETIYKLCIILSIYS